MIASRPSCRSNLGDGPKGVDSVACYVLESELCALRQNLGNLRKRLRLPTTMKTNCLLRPALLALLLVATGCPVSLWGQAVIALPQYAESKNGATQGPKKPAPLSSIGSALMRGGPLWQRGPIALRPHFSYSLMYGDGLLNADQLESGKSIIQTASVGMLAEIGKHWTLDYVFSKVVYSNRYLADSSDHRATLAGGLTRPNWTLGVSQTYSSDSPTLVETGTQTKQQSYASQVSGTIHLGTRTFVDLGITRSVRNVSAPARTAEWAASDWLSWMGTVAARYKFTSDWEASVDWAYGYDDVSSGEDMEYTRPQAQLSWRPSPKISVSARAGTEIRNFKSARTDELRTPIYSLSASYAPIDVTSFSFSASRQLAASYFANQGTRTTSVQVGLSQRLLQRYFLTASLGRHRTSYFATTSGVIAGRTDEGSTVTARISTPFMRRGSLAFMYQIGRNASNRVDFGFSSHQVGMEMSYRF